MTTCEYCGRELVSGDAIHGIRYGSLTASGFHAAKESAVTVICGDCGTLVTQLVYSHLDLDKLKYPVIFKLFTELKASMDNGYKMIQNIANLSAIEQRAIQRLVRLGKEGTSNQC